jgi:hypothetical protein
MAAAPIFVLKTLTSAKVLEHCIRYGPLVFTAIQTASTLVTDRETRKETKAHRQVAEQLLSELPNLKINAREVRVPSNAFNSASTFNDLFLAAAVAGILVEAREGVAALKNIGVQLEGIKDEISRQTLAKFAGYEQTGFASFVYEFIKTEINAHGAPSSSDGKKHFFYVFHPDTIWYPRFETLLGETPLSKSFRGYSSDIEAIFLLMWTNRKTLVETTDDGADAVFHLLVPSDRFSAIAEPFVIDPDIGPLVIKGHRYNAANLVWFNILSRPPSVTLQDVGNIPNSPKPVPPLIKTYLGCWSIAMLSPVCLIFPPLAPLTGPLFLTAWSGAMGSFAGLSGQLAYEELTKVPPRRLGKPFVQTSQAQA